jgi:histidinol-phosphatase
MIDPDIRAWDICAASVLVREAGGRFTDLGGAETIHGGSGLATNGLLHDAVLGVLAGP